MDERLGMEISRERGYAHALRLVEKAEAPDCTICGARKRWSYLLGLWVCPNGARCIRPLIR